MQVDIKVAMVISLSIILLSVATAVTMIVCCFTHGCPLYDTCSGGYKRAANLPYGSDYDGSDQVRHNIVQVREGEGPLRIQTDIHLFILISRTCCRGMSAHDIK